MKTYILAILIVLSIFLASPSRVFAQSYAQTPSHAELQRQIEILLGVVANLQAQLIARNAQGTPDPVRILPPESRDVEIEWLDSSADASSEHGEGDTYDLRLNLGYPLPTSYRVAFECSRGIDVYVPAYGEVCDDTLTFNDPTDATFLWEVEFVDRSMSNRGTVEATLRTYRNGRSLESVDDSIRVYEADERSSRNEGEVCFDGRDNDRDGAVDEGCSNLSVRITSPDEGDEYEVGDDIDIKWRPHSKVPSDVRYELILLDEEGNFEEIIVTSVRGISYEWEVPSRLANTSSGSDYHIEVNCSLYGSSRSLKGCSGVSEEFTITKYSSSGSGSGYFDLETNLRSSYDSGDEVALEWRTRSREVERIYLEREDSSYVHTISGIRSTYDRNDYYEGYVRYTIPNVNRDEYRFVFILEDDRRYYSDWFEIDGYTSGGRSDTIYDIGDRRPQ